MINAERILLTLDRSLDHEVSLVIYGRAAVALSFASAPEAVGWTLDVDVIIPVSQVPRFQEDTNFWDAQEAANRLTIYTFCVFHFLFAAAQDNWTRASTARRKGPRNTLDTFVSSSKGTLRIVQGTTGKSRPEISARHGLGGAKIFLSFESRLAKVNSC